MITEETLRQKPALTVPEEPGAAPEDVTVDEEEEQWSLIDRLDGFEECDFPI